MPSDGKVDLHLHTTASDGRLTPEELVRLAYRNGVRRMAVSDHDTTNGLPAAIAEGRRLGVEIIPAIELSCDVAETEVHILGHFLRYEDAAFQEMLAKFRAARYGRAQKMVEKLNELGLRVSWERVKAIAGDAAVGRPHVARALVEAGYVASLPEAFDRYIGRNGPAYVERFKLTPAEAIALLHSVGATATLAHPRETAGTVEMIPELAAAGLDGVEVYYYRDYGPGALEELLALTRRYGLVPTGGSDYHGNVLSGLVTASNEPGTVAIPPEVVDELWERRVRLFGAD